MTLTPEMWSAVHDMQAPLMQGLMGNYLEQSKNLFVQMQEKQMQKQTEQMFPGISA
jgi:polyhydroxyalkanoate synthesis regulator protein